METSPKGGLRVRVNDIDVRGSRVYRIDVSVFLGLASGRNRCFLDLAGLCEQDGCWLQNCCIMAIM